MTKPAPTDSAFPTESVTESATTMVAVTTEPAAEPVTTTAPDPFDPASLRLDPDAFTNVGAKKLLTTVPVRKPMGQEWFRVHPGEDFRVSPAGILDLKTDFETYLVAPHLVKEIENEVVPVNLFTAVSRQGVPFIWPVRLPDPDGRINSFHRSAAEAAELAMTRWIRMQANMKLKAYDITEGTGNIPDPKWPEHPLSVLLRVAFRDRYIDRIDHPVLVRLRSGE